MARVAFIQNLAYEYLGVMHISAVLKRHGHAVDVFLVTGNEQKGLEEIASFAPDILGFSCTTGVHKWALNFADKAREITSGRIIFGGPHATYFPEIINEPNVDIICRGEGEYALLEIADKIDNGIDITDTMSCWFKAEGKVIKNEQRPLIADLDELPFPDRDMYLRKYPFMKRSQKAFLGGRGCPFECTFCFNHAFKNLYKGKGRIVRYRSVDNLISEIKDVRKKYGMRTVYMQDDTLILNRKWVAEFCDTYRKEIGLPFVCLIRADFAAEDVIRMLSEAGCKNVFFGIESGSEHLRNVLLKKKVTDGQIRKAAALLKKYNIKFRTYNMLGLPGETIEDAFKTVKINAEIGTDYPWCSIFHPFPGTEIAEYVKETALLDVAAEDAHPSFFKDSIVKSAYKRELVNLQKLFFYGVKFPSLIPLIKKLIRFRPNVFFDFAFLISYAWCYLLSENLTLKEVFSTGIRNVNKFFFSKEG